MKNNAYIIELLNKIRLHNNEEALKSLFLLLHTPLFRFSFNITQSQEESEEIVSDIFIEIWKKRNQLHEISSPRNYFYQAVKNKSLNRLAKQKRQTALDTGQWLTPMNSVYFNPEKTMISGEIIKNINCAINKLPPRCRIIFKLIKEDGLKYAEVAGLLEISIKTVESQMAIALKRIALCMHLDIPVRSTEL